MGVEGVDGSEGASEEKKEGSSAASAAAAEKEGGGGGRGARSRGGRMDRAKFRNIRVSFRV